MPVPVEPDAEWLWANEPCRRRVPRQHRRRRIRDRDRGRPLRGRLPDRPSAEPVPVGLRAGVRGTVRTRVPKGQLDAPVSIRALKRFVTERFGVESFAANTYWHAAHGEVPVAAGPSVGIIGGGPAGLAAACDLRLAGHPVTVYEAQDRLGGMMVLGIPEYRLPRSLIEREVEAIIELGIDVETNARVGQTHAIERSAGPPRRGLRCRRYWPGP